MLLRTEGCLDLLTYLLGVVGDLHRDLVEHVLGFLDDGIEGALPIRDLQHVSFELRGHIGFGDASSMLLQ